MAPGSRLPKLGALELAVLEHLWAEGEDDVQGAHRAIAKARKITVNTVGSALERLYKKGLASRAKVSHAYRYQAAIDREAFAAARILDARWGEGGLAQSGLLSAFVDLVADEDEASLDALEALINKKRGGGS